MGVVNVTPDSFSDGGKYLAPERAVAHALALLDEGADLIDLGAESTRPGSGAGSSSGLSADEEQSRLMPVLEALLRERQDAIVSIDTYKARTARAAVLAGAEIVNDVSGLMWDAAMASICAEVQCGVVLMHTRGRPVEWKTLPALGKESVVPLVLDGLAGSIRLALAAGMQPQSIVLDPGYGFGKRSEENFDLLARQGELLALGYPLLAGLSRKSFLVKPLSAGRIPGTPESADAARETASVAAMVAAILKGASIVRVHSVSSAVAAAAIADATLAAEST